MLFNSNTLKRPWRKIPRLPSLKPQLALGISRQPDGSATRQSLAGAQAGNRLVFDAYKVSLHISDPDGSFSILHHRGWIQIGQVAPSEDACSLWTNADDRSMIHGHP